MTENDKDVMLTTVDNPYDPFTQFASWYRYDMNAGYNTCGTLARVMCPSNNLTEAEFDDAYLDAARTIIDFYRPETIYILVPRKKAKQFGKSRN